MVQPDPVAATGPPAAALAELATLFRERRHAELERAAQSLLAHHPDHGFLWKALGVAHAAQGREAEALAAKTRAAQLLPHDSEAQLNLANALLALRRFDEAGACLRRAVAADPRCAAGWSLLASLLTQQGRVAQALVCLHHLTAVRPASPDAYNALGNLQREAGQMPQARSSYRRALSLRPRFAQAHCNLANTLADLGVPAEAVRHYQLALAGLPDQAEIHSNLGNLLKDLGRLPEAQAAYRCAIEKDPRFDGAHSNLLLAMNHDPALAPAIALEDARRFGQTLMQRVPGPLAGRAPAPVGRPLRVGLVSGDLRNHPVGYFLESVLARMDPARVTLLAYSTLRREDGLTARIKPRFGAWTCIAGMDDEAAACLIHADRVDVLLDLAGHTAYNRLGVFAWRPAPVQASWLGYFATTGLPAMDWLIADRASVPETDHSHFTERIWYLPQTRLCFTPPAQAPAVGPPPALAKGCVTFGSFQNLGKVHEGVLGLWARVLSAVPGSRLRWQTTLLADEEMRNQVRNQLDALGIDAARLEFHGKVSRHAYLAAYNEVDVVLDSFPYPGGTTTCEALWMGVPTVTLQGDRMLSRQGAALLAEAGVPQWIAVDEDDYVRKAVALAGEPATRAELRAGLRKRVAASALFDAQQFATDLQDALLAMAMQTG